MLINRFVYKLWRINGFHPDSIYTCLYILIKVDELKWLFEHSLLADIYSWRSDILKLNSCLHCLWYVSVQWYISCHCLLYLSVQLLLFVLPECSFSCNVCGTWVLSCHYMNMSVQLSLFVIHECSAVTVCDTWEFSCHCLWYKYSVVTVCDTNVQLSLFVIQECSAVTFCDTRVLSCHCIWYMSVHSAIIFVIPECSAVTVYGTRVLSCHCLWYPSS